MLFDIAVIGVFIFALTQRADNKRERQREIQRYEDEIEDFREWKNKEAAYRTTGNIKRLNRLGITEINLTLCYLDNMNLGEVDLKGAIVFGASCKNTSFVGAKFNGADLGQSSFQNAAFMGADLRKTKNLTSDQLAQVESLFQAKLDPELEKEIKEKHPHLFERPEI